MIIYVFIVRILEYRIPFSDITGGFGQGWLDAPSLI